MVHLHAVTMHIPFTRDGEMARIQQTHWVEYHAFLAVDGFFVLSGFLLGGQLLRGEVTTDAVGIRRYVLNRVLRLMLPIAVALAWYCWVMCAGGGPGYAGLMRSERLQRLFDTMMPGAEYANGQCNVWVATALHVQNFLPYNGCMAHLWQVSVLFHAYVWLPQAWRRWSLHRGRNLALAIAVVEVATLVGRTAAQWNQAGHLEGGVMAGMLELHWYAYAPLRIHHVLLGAGAAWLWHNTPIAAVLRIPTLGHKVFHAVLGLAAPVALVYVSAVWAGTFGDYRFTRSFASWLYYAFVTFGTVTWGVLWCYLVLAAAAGWGVFAPASWWFSKPSAAQLAAVAAATAASAEPQPVRAAVTPAASSSPHAPSASGWSLSRLLAHPSLRWWADRTYWVYVLHLPLVMWLYSHPWLLFPTSPGDARPASLLRGEPVARTAVRFDAAAAGALAPVLQAWAAARSRWLQPEGTPLRGTTMALVTCIALALSFAAAALLHAHVEEPVVAWIKRHCAGAAQQAAWVYACAVAGLALVLHLVGTPLFVAFQDDVEAALPRLARSMAH